MKWLAAMLFLVASAVWSAPWQGITAMSASVDGRWFATGGREGEVLLWETSTGEIQGRWPVSRLPVAGLAFSADGAWLGVITLDGTCSAMKLLDGTVTPGDLKGRWKALADVPAKTLSRSPLLFGVAASWKDLKAKGGTDGTISVTTVDGVVTTWQAHDAALTALVFTPDGTLLSAGYDGSLGRWDARTGRALGRL